MNQLTLLPLFLGLSLLLARTAHAQTTNEPIKTIPSRSLRPQPEAPQPIAPRPIPQATLRVPPFVNAAEVSALESRLESDPNDLEARTTLLRYYLLDQFRSEASRKLRQKHVLWIIEHQPTSPLAGTPEGKLDKILDKDVYTEGKDLWAEQVKKHSTNAIVLGNAAYFHLMSDRDEAEQLYRQAVKLEPDSPTWHDKLGHLYSLGRKANSNSLIAYEAAQQLDKREITRFYRLPKLTKSALLANDENKALAYADELLKQADKQPPENVGDAIHHGNVTKGHVALRKGDVSQAKEYLLKAGAASGSPILNTSGPNMSLAKALLEKGERDVVLEYFDQCRKFWKNDDLDKWTAEVKAGKTPNFSNNLLY